jgi:carboxymethylenebutenolidase
VNAGGAGIKSENVRVARGRDGRHPMEAYLAQPDAAGRLPGVVVIHELFGLDDNIRHIARRFARKGYVALAVDLFSTGGRLACIFRIVYGMLIRPLQNGVVGDLQAAVQFLQRQPGVNAQRIGVIGFCMGGTYALQLACVDGDVRVAAPFYGMNPRPLEAVARACPIVGSYPEKDFTASAARQLEAALERYDVPHDVRVYAGARHSFFNDTRPAYDAQASADAWARTLAFFETYLQAGDASEA